MPDCTHLSDRMPAVAAGGDGWSAADMAHLEECPDCTAEWALVRTGASLGLDSGVALDADRLASAVLGRLRAERIARRRSRRRASWAVLLAAAAIALTVWTGRPERRPPAAAAPVESAALVPELDSLDAVELKDVLDSFDAPLSERVIPVSPTLGDLSDQELERVLRAGGV
jgi:hypothetical protein